MLFYREHILLCFDVLMVGITKKNNLQVAFGAFKTFRFRNIPEIAITLEVLGKERTV
jgi:hypothetical protein